MVNPREFQRFGLAWRRGEFSSLSPESYEYEEIWREEYRRCLEGYCVGGDCISGELYYYVNFHLIQMLDEGTGRKSVGLPQLRDVEREFFGLYSRAKKEKKGLMMISGRRLGKSYMTSGLLVYNFIFCPNSRGCVGAGDQDKGRDLMQKVRDGIFGLKGTEFYLPLIKDNVDEELQSGWREKDRYNNWVPRCTDRVIYFRNFKNKHTAANGLSTDLFVFEEVGMFSNLIMSYNSSSPCWREGSQNYGVPVLVGTGGDMEGGSVDAQRMFEDPETYGLLSFCEEWGGRCRAFFMPAWKALNDYKDEYGNSRKEEAVVFIERRREMLRRGHQLTALMQEIQYYPLRPEEAFLSGTGNVFPLVLLQEQVERVLRTPEFSPRRGYLEERGGEVVFVEDSLAREVDFPVQNGVDVEGCVCIYEEPMRVGGEIPSGLYVLGCDPYAQDGAQESSSLGSCFVYKRFYNANVTGDVIVAEYTGRPASMEQYHEGVRLLCRYYNGKVLYENNVPGLKQHFEVKRSLHLLHSQPDIIKDILKDTVVDRRYGVHMTKQLKLYMVNRIRDWLLTPLSGEGGYRLERVYCLNLLREMMNYDLEEGNFDRVVAFGLCLIQDSEMFRVEVEKVNDRSRRVDFYRDFDERYGWQFTNREYRKVLSSLLGV